MITIKPINHEIQLNFSSSDVKRTVIKQNSVDTHILNISLYDNGQTVNIDSQWEVCISCSKPDNTYILNTRDITFSGNKITVPVTRQMIASPGTVKCELVMTSNTKALYSDTFYIFVEENVQDGSQVESSNEFNSIADTLNKVKDYESQAKSGADSASNSEKKASESSENAKKYETDALSSLNNTKEYESQAKNSADLTSEYEQTSLTDKNTIDGYKNTSATLLDAISANKTQSDTFLQQTETNKSATDHIVEDLGQKQTQINRTYDDLQKAVNDTQDLMKENNTIKQNETERQTNEATRIANETARESAEIQRETDFHTLESELNDELAKAEKVNVESIVGNESYQVKTTDRDGNTATSENLLNKLRIGTVETGSFDEDPTATITGEFGKQKLNLRLPSGKPFVISKVYSSVAEMEADEANLSLYKFVMIHTGSVEEEDTGKLYMKDGSGMKFLTDLSGVQGIQGVKGETGATPQLTIGTVTTGEEGTSAAATITGTTENPVLNLVIPKGDTGSVTGLSAKNLPYESADDEITTYEAVNRNSDSINAHVSDKSNPHGVTKQQVGLENVDNTADAEKSVKYAERAGNASSATKAEQDSDGNVISTTYAKKTDASGGTHVGTSAPANTKLLWVDTGNGGIMKYYNGSAWVTTKAVWG